MCDSKWGGLHFFIMHFFCCIGLLLIQAYCVCASLCEEFLHYSYEVERMDMLGLVAYGVLLYEVGMRSIESARSSRARYRLSARFFLLIGLVQEAIVDGYATRTCKVCERYNALCACLVQFTPILNSMSVRRMYLTLSQRVVRVRERLAGCPIFNQRRPHSAVPAWPAVYQLNKLKMDLYMIYLRCSVVKWEVQYASFLDEVWSYSEPFSDDKQCLLYVWNGIFMRSMYFGETSVGMLGRMTSHLRCWCSLLLDSVSRKRFAKLYVHMRKVGLRRMVMLPLHVWREMVTKIQRLHLETCLVWWRQPRLNVTGTTHFTTRVEGDMFSLPRKKKFRLVRRLVHLERKRAGQRILDPTPDESVHAMLFFDVATCTIIKVCRAACSSSVATYCCFLEPATCY